MTFGLGLEEWRIGPCDKGTVCVQRQVTLVPRVWDWSWDPGGEDSCVQDLAIQVLEPQLEVAVACRLHWYHGYTGTAWGAQACHVYS